MANGAFQFFTNYGSRKARELDENPRAALVFHWPARAWQVRVEGRVERLRAEDSDAYWATRPRESQLGAYASRQSEPLTSRQALEDRFAEAQKRFGGQGAIPRPEFWGGYAVIPERIEFWTGRENRLHERTLYTRLPEGGWKAELISP